MAAEFLDEFLYLRLAPKKPVGLFLPHRPQADERLVNQDERLVPIRLTQDGLDELLELLAVAERIANALIAFGERRQRA